jgi:fluoroquinolone transport system ATP-binding protein
MMETVIESRELTFAYGKLPVLKGLSFQVNRGEILGLLGPSGAGKSTATRLMTGLMDGYSGNLRVLGQNPAERGKAFYGRLGIAHEVPRLYTRLTGRENLQLALDLYGVQAAIETEVHALGLSGAIDQPVSTYSKGMRQRLEVIRAFLHGPELVFLDEPTSGLDPALKSEVVRYTERKRMEGATILIATHDMAVAEKLCDRVALLDRGVIRALDAPASLRSALGESRCLVESQIDGRVERHAFALDRLHDNPDFLRCLQGKILSIHTTEPTLDEVFINLTKRTGETG